MKYGNQITNPGELDKPVVLKKPTVTSGAGAFQVKNYTPVATVWAKCRGVHGLEAWAAEVKKALYPMTVTIRYRADIKATWAIEIDGHDYEIVAPPDDIYLRHEYIEIKVQRIMAG